VWMGRCLMLIRCFPADRPPAEGTSAQEVIKVEPFDGALFVYIGRPSSALKSIYWDYNRLVLRRKCVDGEESSVVMQAAG